LRWQDECPCSRPECNPRRLGYPVQMLPFRAGARSQEIETAIGGTTVKHELFHVGVALRPHAFQRFFEEASLIEGWGDDGNFDHNVAASEDCAKARARAVISHKGTVRSKFRDSVSPWTTANSMTTKTRSR